MTANILDTLNLVYQTGGDSHPVGIGLSYED